MLHSLAPMSHLRCLIIPRLTKARPPGHTTSNPRALMHHPIRLCHSSNDRIIIPPIHIPKPRYDVFINHRGIDTKRGVASLLYHYLSFLEVRPFLDCYSMKPGDNLYDEIKGAILGCKVGVAVFSPRYCESTFCLKELALLMDAKKKVIPIFCDVTPLQIRNLAIVRCDGYTSKEVLKLRSALVEATRIVGLSFDSSKGYAILY